MGIEHKGIDLKAEGQGKITAIFATLNVVDKQNDITLPGAFQSGQQVKIMGWNHDWSHFPIGKGIIGEEAERAILNGQLFMDTVAGKDAFNALKNLGELAEWSYGFTPLESDQSDREGQRVRILKKVQVHEVSPVMMGAGMETGTLAMKSKAQQKGAMGAHSTDKADEDTEWDAGTAMREAEGEAQLRRMHAWVDDEADPDAKTSYKLPHHTPDGTVIWRGVAAAMAALLGGRGGVDIPREDRRGVYNHLIRHYSQFDKEPPEFRADTNYLDHLEATLLDVESLLQRSEDRAAFRVKEGRRLSAANRERINRLVSSMRELMGDMTKLLEQGEPQKEKLLRVAMEYQKIVARFNGVQI